VGNTPQGELWYSTRPKPKDLKELSGEGAQVRDIKKMQGGIMGLVGAYGVLGEAAIKAGQQFEDSKLALEALGEQHPKVLEEPKRCVFCGEEGERVRHEFDTIYMRRLPIWTRVCDDCAGDPLCDAHPWGIHEEFVTASNVDFKVKYTTVVDLRALDDCGHCRDCGLPAIFDHELMRWRYWTPLERSRLL
jgi:hypothetical protein